LANRPQATAPALDSTLQNMDMMREAIEKRASETLATEDAPSEPPIERLEVNA
jgi:hypothetical protein